MSCNPRLKKCARLRSNSDSRTAGWGEHVSIKHPWRTGKHRADRRRCVLQSKAQEKRLEADKKTSVAEHAARIHLLQTCSRRREQRKKGAVKPTPCVKKDAVKPTPCVKKNAWPSLTRPEKKAMTYACALWRLRLAFPAAARFAAAALMAAGPASSFKYATRRSQTASGASDFEAHGRGAPKCTRKP